MERINKKGSHIGIVISFVIFMTFIVFLYSISNPAIKTEKSDESLIEYLEPKIIQEVSSGLTTIYASSSDAGYNCIGIQNYPGVGFSTIAKNAEDVIIDSYISGSNLYLEPGEDFVKVFYSEDSLEQHNFNFEDCLEIGTTAIDFQRTEKYVSESKIVSLIEDLNNEGYEELKTQFNFVESKDFGIGFVNDETEIETESSDLSTNIYVEEIPIQYFDNQANIKNGFLKIRVW